MRPHPRDEASIRQLIIMMREHHEVAATVCEEIGRVVDLAPHLGELRRVGFHLRDGFQDGVLVGA
jgi:hypothetical protein